MCVFHIVRQNTVHVIDYKWVSRIISQFTSPGCPTQAHNTDVAQAAQLTLQLCYWTVWANVRLKRRKKTLACNEIFAFKCCFSQLISTFEIFKLIFRKASENFLRGSSICENDQNFSIFCFML